jgi:molybdenum cofactor cytidylyltransferase
MYLTLALRLDQSARLALVGAGGKTAALFALGRQLSRPAPRWREPDRPARPAVNQIPAAGRDASPPQTVLLSATTHLATDQIALADYHFTLLRKADLDGLADHLPTGMLLFTGPAGEDGRTAGLQAGLMERLRLLADQRRLPLLVEADGSRRLPLKAPAPHEPVIPEWVNTVVVVAGLSGLGKPLDPAWVHRPEIFSHLSGLELIAPVTSEGLVNVLTHPQGGLKSIPHGARRMVLLNQAGTAELQAVAQRLARPILAQYDGVVVADLPPIDLPVGEDTHTGVIAVYERVAGVILAAGGAQRMGRPKQSLLWHGQPLVRHVAQAALEASLDPVVVVSGSAAGQVEAAVEGLAVQLVHNPDWQSGQSSSVKAGICALPAETGAAMFLLADQPGTPAALIASLVEAHAATLSPLVAPLVQGQRANPVLMDRVTFPDLLSLSGDQGGRALFSRYPVQWVPWHDAVALQDIDTPEDYQRLLET